MTQVRENGYPATQWKTTNAESRGIVLQELEAILSSYHFRGSKRYPSLLRYVVNAALEGREGDLKERTLGVEVFGRNPGYDTNVDPVVRVSAGEVRKRIAQYYHEKGHRSQIQIELPLGSYVPEILLREPETAGIEHQEQARGVLASEGGKRNGGIRLLASVFGLGVILGAGVLGAAIYYRHPKPVTSKPTVFDELWAPMLETSRPVLIVLRTAPPAKKRAEFESADFADHVHYVSVSIAVALAQLASALNQHGKFYEVKEASETTLTDISSRPVILVGAMDNDWTMRLTSQLRFHFAFLPDGTEWIEDNTAPRQRIWQFNRFQPFSSVTADYAIVARFHDSTTDGPVMIIAGLGPYGTEAAGQFVQSSEHLAQLSKILPPGWENKNIELVLRTDIIGYQAGPPVLLHAYTW